MFISPKKSFWALLTFSWESCVWFVKLSSDCLINWPWTSSVPILSPFLLAHANESRANKHATPAVAREQLIICQRPLQHPWWSRQALLHQTQHGSWRSLASWDRGQAGGGGIHGWEKIILFGWLIRGSVPLLSCLAWEIIAHAYLMKWKSQLLFSCSVVSDSFATPWTLARQASLSMGFHRQEYWSGSPLPSPGDLPGPGIEPTSPALAGDSLPLSQQESLKEPVGRKKLDEFFRQTYPVLGL